MRIRHNINLFIYYAILCTISLIVPIYSPLKIILSPSSIMLASHTAIFLAMFTSPLAAVVVSLVTTVGLYIYGFQDVAVLRAATHLAFSQFGALYLAEKPQILERRSRSLLFSFLFGCLHAFAETVVVIPYYFGHSLSASTYTYGFFRSVIVYVGVVTIIHSMVDFELALLLWKPLKKKIMNLLNGQGE